MPIGTRDPERLTLTVDGTEETLRPAKGFLTRRSYRVEATSTTRGHTYRLVPDSLATSRLLRDGRLLGVFTSSGDGHVTADWETPDAPPALRSRTTLPWGTPWPPPSARAPNRCGGSSWTPYSTCGRKGPPLTYGCPRPVRERRDAGRTGPCHRAPVHLVPGDVATDDHGGAPMDPRLNYSAVPTAGKALKHFMSAGKAIGDSPLPTATRELVALRVSQINGCAACVDMHTKEAAAAARPRCG